MTSTEGETLEPDEPLRKEFARAFGVGPDEVLIIGDRAIIRPNAEETPPRPMQAFSIQMVDEPGGEGDLTDELLDMGALDRVHREVVPPEERTRRTLLITLGVVYGALLVVQIGFALTLSAARYQVVGGLLTTVSTLLAGGLGAAFAYYFTQQRDRG